MAKTPIPTPRERQTPPARPIRHTRHAFAVLIGLGGALAVALIVLAFVWPVATANPHNVPLVVVGPEAQVSQLESTLKQQTGGFFEITDVVDRDAAVSAIEQHSAFGAIVLGERPEVLTSSAANLSISNQLKGFAGMLQQEIAGQVSAHGGDPSSVKVSTTDVVPLSSSDPNGAGLVVTSFPLVLGGVIGGVLVSLLVVGTWRRVIALTVYAVVGSLVVTTVLQTWFSLLQGDFLLNAAAVGLTLFATASLIVGFNALIGGAGIGVGAVLTMLIGNPISGASMPWEFVAGPWGAIGQHFVPGAASTLIRDISYFPAAETSAQWLTLAAWAAGGLLLSIAGKFRNNEPIPLPESELEPLPSTV